MLKKTLVLALAIVVTFLTPASALAEDGSSSFARTLVHELSAARCGSGAPFVNVIQAVRNDADSGVAGNAWANDNYLRSIRVWRTSSTSFCAIVAYGGTFTTYAGPSPQNTGTVAAGVHGLMYGGRRATITGTLRASPQWPTRGFVGTANYACDTNFNCPGRFNWYDKYFDPVTSYSDDWWGWRYDTRSNGSWINAIGGNSGDITSP